MSNVTFQTDGLATPPTGTVIATDEYEGLQFQRVQMVAQDDSGAPRNLATTGEGHLEVAIHGPINPFGSVHVERLVPIFQCDAVYGINTQSVTATTGRAIAGSGSGTATAADNLFTCSTGTTSFSFATIQSRKRLRYRPGQGIVGRFTAIWSTPAASSIVVAGLGHAESGYFFGYNGTSFGVLHSTGGVREVQTLTVTTASTSTNDYNVTLPNGTVVNVTATNNGNTARTAWEIAQGTFPGWLAEPRGSTVVFISSSAGTVSSTFSLAQSGAGTPAAGTCVETTAGVASTDTWVAQTDWNGDKLDGTGASGVTLDPAKGNVFQIGIQYLGFGSVEFKVETCSSDGNNADFVTVHTLRFPNTRTIVNTSNPSFPFTMAAYSAGSTTDVSVSSGSFAGFIEGEKVLTGPRFNYVDTSTVISTGAYYALLTIRNGLVYANRANQSVVNLLSFGAAHDDATPITFFVLKNAALVGNPSFSSWSAFSCTYVDTAATTATITDNAQIIFAITVGQSGSILVPFEDDVTLQPGESITLAATATTGTATFASVSLNTREDQ
jgi:hypothetical protein